MSYDYRIKVDDSYTLDNSAKSDGTPYLSGAVVHDCSSSEDRLTIGGTVSNKLTVLFHNPPTTSFDGMKLELSIIESAEEGDNGADVSVTVSDIDQFMSDMEIISDGTNSDSGSDITLHNISDIGSDPASTTDNYEVPQEGSSGSNSEEPSNENYRDTGTDISGASSPDTETITDWIKFGTYYVTSYKKIANDTYELTALDGFILMGDTYTPGITSGTIAQYYTDFTSQLDDMGINVNDEVFPDVSLAWEGGFSYREAAGYFASLIGAYATFGREGYLDLRAYLKSTEVIPFTNVIDYRETANDININAVACDRIPSASATDYITAGEDDTIEMEFINPFMTTSLLQNVLNLYLYTTYTPCVLNCKYTWGLQSGDFVQLELEEDTKWICITNMQIALDEGNAIIYSMGNSAALATNKNVSKTMRDIIEAGKTATNYITEDDSGALVIRRDTDNFSVRIDADSVDIMDGETVVASYGEETVIGGEYPLIIKNDGVYLPNTGGIKIADSRGRYRDIGNLAIFSAPSLNYDGQNNLIGKSMSSILSDGTLEIYGTFKIDRTGSTNSAFGTNTGLYYFEDTIYLGAIINKMNALGFGDYDAIASSGNVFMEVSTNGNSGSGYVTPWRTIYTHLGIDNSPYISTRFVSTSSSSPKIVSVSYHIRIGTNTE